MKITRLYVLLLLLLLCTRIHAVQVVFRFDDPRLVCDSVSMRTIALFNDKQIPLTIAMVPCDSNENQFVPVSDKDSVFIAAVNSENIEIALHGLTHQYVNNKGEFGDLDANESLRRITKGISVLQSIFDKEITTFIPPFNAWNEHTLTAMRMHGMNVISADMFTPIYADSVHYFPETLGHLMAQKGMWHAAEEVILGCKEKDAVCVVMFHAYDLPDEASWQRLEKLLDACKADKDVQMHTFRSLYESGNTSSQYRYRANQLHSLLQKHLLYPGVLHTTWLCWLVHVSNALIYALLPLLALLLGWCAFKRKKVALSKPLVGVGILLSLVFCALAILQIGTPLKVLAADVALSGCLLVYGMFKR